MRFTGRVQVSCSYNGICLADLTATGGFVTQATVQTGPTITLVTTAALSSVVSVRQASRQPAEIWAFHVWRPCRVGARGLMQAASHLAFTSLDGARGLLHGSNSPCCTFQAGARGLLTGSMGLHLSRCCRLLEAEQQLLLLAPCHI